MTQFGDPPSGRGHPGKWIRASAQTGVFDATGSAFGVAGILISGSTTGTASLSDGGSIPLEVLSTGIIHEVGVSSLNVTAGTVYVLYKRHTAI